MEVRIDKYLWCIRLFKTRSQASEACRSGKVLINNIAAKASREIKAGDHVKVRLGIITKELMVIEPIDHRVSAKMVESYYRDITPASTYEKLQFIKELNHERREKGLGRPSKKDRRVMDKLKGK